MSRVTDVRVVARVRGGPDAPVGAVGDASDGTSITVGEQRFGFDHVIPADVPQAEAVALVAADTAARLLDGYNASVLAYGQTSTGKTYLMNGTEEKPGVVPSVLGELVGRDGVEVELACVELYLDNFRDLLRTANEPSLRVDSRCGVSFSDLAFYKTDSVEAVRRRLRCASKNRAVGATDINKHSSRSHAAVVVRVITARTKATCLMVDLAGSESHERAGGGVGRGEEARANNLALAALGRMVQALARGETPVARDSKLTRMLQMALGGASRTTVVVTVAGGKKAASETLRTLTFAADARRVKQTAKRNVRKKTRALNQEIERLRLLLEQEKNTPPAVVAVAPDVRICDFCQQSIDRAAEPVDRTTEDRLDEAEQLLELYRMMQAAHEKRLLRAEHERDAATNQAARLRKLFQKAQHQLQPSAPVLDTPSVDAPP